MSEVAIGGPAASQSSFARGTALLVVGIGIFAFIAMLVLSAYAPELRSGNNGGSHALSKAATGFSGIVQLADATGRNPEVVRSRAPLSREELLVVSPDSGAADLTELLDERGARVTMIVLPKWDSAADPKRQGWVRVDGPAAPFVPASVLAPAHKLQVSRSNDQGRALVTHANHAPAELRFMAPKILQTISGANVQPVITDSRGRIVLGQLGNQPLFVLADPDLLNNHGMKDPGQAQAALALLDFLNVTDADAILFDVTANGLGGSRSPLRLAFDPPFLAVTLAIAAALLLAGIQALVRFGAPRRVERAIAFGKAALVDNSAALIRRAGRESQLGDRYAEVVRRRAAELLRIPPGLSEQDMDARLDAAGDQSFTTLAERADQARRREDLTIAARGLHRWLKELKA